MRERRLTLLTFGFKYGAPPCNHYLDVSFLENPARQAGWTLFDRPDDGMREFVLSQPLATRFIDAAEPLIDALLDADDDLRVGIGCSSGRHRSNIVADELRARFEARGVRVRLIQREEAFA